MIVAEHALPAHLHIRYPTAERRTNAPPKLLCIIANPPSQASARNPTLCRIRLTMLSPRNVSITGSLSRSRLAAHIYPSFPSSLLPELQELNSISVLLFFPRTRYLRHCDASRTISHSPSITHGYLPHSYIFFAWVCAAGLPAPIKNNTCTVR